MSVTLATEHDVNLQVASPRILLISGTSPGEPGVGGVILRDLVAIAGPENMHACWLNPLRNERPHYLSQLSTSFHERRYEHGWRPVKGLAGEFAAYGAASLLRNKLVSKTVGEVQSEIIRFQPDLILTVLESGMAVQVMRRLLPNLRVPLRTIVWDDVETFCPEGNLDRWTRSSIKTDFACVLKASERIAVICENMQQAYQRDYGISSFVIRHGMPEAEVSQGRASQQSNVLRIGFAGSITTPDCVQSFIAALDGMEWQHAGTNICLRILGARFQLGTRCKQWIEYFGWRDVTETRNLLGECDVLYLPQSFLPHLRHLSELSFPTKLSTYVAARTPILLQAPGYGSLSSYWQSYALGPHVGSLEMSHLQSGLQSVFDASSQQIEQWQQSIRKAHQDTLSVDLFDSGVKRLLSLHPNS